MSRIAPIFYALLCGIANTFEVAAPPDGDKLPA
jgi:hypothetical protein